LRCEEYLDAQQHEKFDDEPDTDDDGEDEYEVHNLLLAARYSEAPEYL
jgi:hypothetical protein